ncbi:hypothetical protein GCM10018952_36710 [Streptosporangium vulgare]
MLRLMMFGDRAGGSRHPHELHALGRAEFVIRTVRCGAFWAEHYQPSDALEPPLACYAAAVPRNRRAHRAVAA